MRSWNGQPAQSGKAHLEGRSVRPRGDAKESWQARASGWAFGINVFLAFVVLILAVSLASVVDLRSNGAITADPTSDPASPLTISGVSLVEGAIDGESVHVGATQQSLIVSFAAASLWHDSARSCLADIFGVLDWEGQATWVGARAGHADQIVGDPSSADAYVAGLGQYCETGRFTSQDGGLSWSSGSVGPVASSDPSWLAFDPVRPRTLLAYYRGNLYSSPDAGASWTSIQTTVVPLAFDSAGRLVGWSPGKLFASPDDGASWVEIGTGPADQPVAAGAMSAGVLIGTSAGLFWYPSDGAPSLIQSGSVYSIAPAGDGAVVLGADQDQHPWLGTVSSTAPGISLATLPNDVATLQITGGEVAANDSGAAIAFSGATSAIGLATFSH